MVHRSSTPAQLRTAIITGTRAEFGLLLPIIRMLRADDRFVARVVATGVHLLPGAETWHEVEDAVGIDARVPMQECVSGTRVSDAIALGRGVAGFAATLPTLFGGMPPDWVLILGDRIEAFAAASAASVAGLPIAHLHGGDRAEGVADEAMRHAITKLANLHLPATPKSAERIRRMGEPDERIVCVGSPAVCGLENATWSDPEGIAPGPSLIVLHHPCGLPDKAERELASAIAEGVMIVIRTSGIDAERVLWLAPNADPGAGVVRSVLSAAADESGWSVAEHLARDAFVQALAGLARFGGALIGNSSAGLIEAAAMRVGVVNCGPRQRGRERVGNVIDIRDHAVDITAAEVAKAIERARRISGRPCSHPYGDGNTDRRVLDALLAIGRLDAVGVRKRCMY